MKCSWPPRLSLTPSSTPLQLLKRFSQQLNGTRLWVKRDDLTGFLLSGNKVRKLEFTIAHALQANCDLLITCGGLQSNHCRATAFLGAQLGIPVHLVLRGDKPKNPIKDTEGNLLLDYLSGATVNYFSVPDYQKNLPEILNRIAEKYREQGYRPYIIPTGASDGVGVWGYFAASQELGTDFQTHDIKPELIVTATGSGGTQAGLTLGSQFFNLGCSVVGMAVCDNQQYFQNKVKADIQDFCGQFEEQLGLPIGIADTLSIQTVDRYVGKGYGIVSDSVLDMIIALSKEEGILLDPVYTGKAFYGLVCDIQAGQYSGIKDIVFIHTGGGYGVFPYRQALMERLHNTST